MTHIVLLFLIYIHDDVCYYSPISSCVVFFLSLYTCFFIVCNPLFLFHTKMPYWVLFKVFQKDKLSKFIMPWTLILQSFSRVCVRIRFYCIQQVDMSLVIYDFFHTSFFFVVVLHRLPKGEIVRSYVELVRTYVIVNWLIFWQKNTLLIIG